MSTPLSSHARFEALRTLTARRPAVRWALRIARWAITLAVTCAGLIVLTFEIGRAHV